MTGDPDVIDVVGLFPDLRGALIALLGELSPAGWTAPTACGDWSVQDVALHLVGVEANILSADRDGHRDPPPPGSDLSTWDGLVTFIDWRNRIWVEALGRVSPRLTRDLLAMMGPQVEAWFRGIDLHATGHPVNWAGPDPAPVWVHVAREYTERWVHQQHIWDAVGRPGLTGPEWLTPVLRAFALALPHTLRDVAAPEGAVAGLIVEGPAGGSWWAVRGSVGWSATGERPDDAIATVTLDEDTAWRLFTRGIEPDAVRPFAHLDGDRAITDAMLGMVSIIA